MLKINNVSDTQLDVLKQLDKMNKWQKDQKKRVQEKRNPQVKKNIFKGTYTNKNKKMVKEQESYNSNEHEKKKSVPKEIRKKNIKSPKIFLKKGEGLEQRFKIHPDKLRLNNLPPYKWTKKNSKTNKTKNAETKSQVCDELTVSSETQLDKLLVSSLNIWNSLRKKTENFSDTVPNEHLKTALETIITQPSTSSILSQLKTEHLYGNLPNEQLKTVTETIIPQSSPISILLKREEENYFGNVQEPTIVSETIIPQSLTSLILSKWKEENYSENIPNQQHTTELGTIIPQTSISSILSKWNEEICSGNVPNQQCTPSSETISTASILPKEKQEKFTDNISNQQKPIIEQQSEPEIPNSGNKKLDPIPELPENTNKEENQNELSINEINFTKIIKNDLSISNMGDICNKTLNSVTDRVGYKDKNDAVTSSTTSMKQCYECAENYRNMRDEQQHYTKIKLRIRFAEEKSTAASNDTLEGGNRELCNRLRKTLLNVLQDKIEEELYRKSSTDLRGNTTLALLTSNETEMEPILGPVPITMLDEKEQNETLLKARLSDLDKEIRIFRVNNAALKIAKREHEIEIEKFQQKCLEEQARLKDERILLEIYLYDERMKIEQQKKQFEEEMQMQKSAIQRKVIKRVACLRRELEDVQLSVKQHEHAHDTEQMRLRTQIHILEKEYKKLQAENVRLSNENKFLKRSNSEHVPVLQEKHRGRK